MPRGGNCKWRHCPCLAVSLLGVRQRSCRLGAKSKDASRQGYSIRMGPSDSLSLDKPTTIGYHAMGVRGSGSSLAGNMLKPCCRPRQARCEGGQKDAVERSGVASSIGRTIGKPNPCGRQVAVYSFAGHRARVKCTLSAPKGRPSTAQANGVGYRVTPLGPLALKGRDKTTHRTEGSYKGFRQDSFALSGLPAPKGRILGPRPLAWAVLGRPFGAQFGTRGIWHPRCPTKDERCRTWSGGRRGRGCVTHVPNPMPPRAAQNSTNEPRMSMKTKDRCGKLLSPA